MPLGDDETARIAAVLGVPPRAFSDAGQLRHRDGGACVFAIATGGSYRCAVEADKPRACRVYPFHVEVREDGAWAAALGVDAACPLPRNEAWAARVLDERATIETAILEGNGIAVRKLPVVGDSACFGCTTSCCLDYEVPVNAHDVWRLMRALALPWNALVRVRPTPADYMESFTLDRSGRKHALQLHRHDDGACALLTTLPDGSRRCGVHAARPLACRVYPYRGDWSPGMAVRLQHDAVCPPPQRERYQAERAAVAPAIADQVSERHLYMRALARWDEAAQTRSPAHAYRVDDFLRWSFALYDALEPLRARRPAAFADAAESLIAAFPLPDEQAPGC